MRRSEKKWMQLQQAIDAVLFVERRFYSFIVFNDYERAHQIVENGMNEAKLSMKRELHATHKALVEHALRGDFE